MTTNQRTLMRSFLIILISFIATFSIKGQTIELQRGKNSSGYPYVETIINKPVKMIDVSDTGYIFGDISLVKLDGFMGFSFILGGTDKRIGNISKMSKRGRIEITLSNNEVLSGDYLNLAEYPGPFTRIAINTASILLKSNKRDFSTLSKKEINRYICEQLSSHNIRDITINNTYIYFLDELGAMIYNISNLFLTADIIKKMIKEIDTIK